VSSTLPDKPAVTPKPTNSARRTESEPQAIEHSKPSQNETAKQLATAGTESTLPAPAAKTKTAAEIKFFDVQSAERVDSKISRPVAALSPEPPPIELKLAPEPVRTPVAASSAAPLPPAATGLVAAQPNPRQAGQPISQKDLDGIMQQLQTMQQSNSSAAPEDVPPPKPSTDIQPASNSDSAAKGRAPSVCPATAKGTTG
jgi:hypothetical protein